MIYTIRIFIYVLLSLAIASSLWCGIMVNLYGVEWERLFHLAETALHFYWQGNNPAQVVIFWLSFVLAVSLIGNLYLFIACRVRANSQVHLRGAYMIDQRGDK